MRIGILTFHSQLNYGGVLQAYALQQTLQDMGHNTVVIDHWSDSENRTLELGYNCYGLKGWGNVLVRSLLGGWEWKKYHRVKSTKQFLHDYIHLSPYHFVKWEDAPSDLGLDLIVVGSDQVWHVGEGVDPGPYLLEGAPRIFAISYAASFGITEIPSGLESRYCKGLSRFKHISCRESEGVTLCYNLGFGATHVVDPTLLLEQSEWHNMVKPTKYLTQKKLVCYFMDGNVPKYIDYLESFANHTDAIVDIFLDSRFYMPLPKSIGQLCERFLPQKINLRIESGPLDFIQAIADADFVLTDSFHALMFSCIFDKNIRFLRPENAFRKQMFARIEEFANDNIEGDLFVDDVKTAVNEFISGRRVQYCMDEINYKRMRSREWLRRSITQ